MQLACDENGNQLFDESGAEYHPWAVDGYGYNPNNHEGGTKLVNAKAATATEKGYTGDLYCLGCDELITKGEVIPATGNKTATGDVYEILNGAASVWTPETKTGLVIRSNAAKSKFVEVRINGEVLDEKYYTVTEGSTIITISQEYLSTLENKEYTIEIVSTDGTATTTFTVEGNDAKADIKDDTKKEEPTGATETKKEESVVTTESKKEETVVSTETKKDDTTASTTKTDTTKTDTKSDTKTNTKSDTASSGAKTGDESSLVLWVSSLGISFAALALLAVWNKKRYTGKEK
jgi:flagellin-like hook-associated protein FlgL